VLCVERALGPSQVPSVFFGQHDRDDAPRYGGVGRIGQVVGETLIVIIDLEKDRMAVDRGSRCYHHGNLKEALIRAALELIAAKGRERAFAVIRSAAERLVAQIFAAQRPPAFMVALHVWWLAHGIASLFGRGDAGRRQLPMPPEELLEAGALVISAGSDFPKAAPFRDPGAVRGGKAERILCVGRPFRPRWCHFRGAFP
jgi:hypothetical protein